MSSPLHDYRTRSRWTEMVLILSFWMFLAVLSIGTRRFDRFSEGATTLEVLQTSLPIFLTYLLWATLTPAIFWLISRYGIDRGNQFVRIPVHLLIAFAVAIGVDLYADLIRVALLPPPGRRGGFHPSRAILRLWFLNEFIIYLAILAAGLARDYSLRYKARREETLHLRAQADRLQVQLSEARLQALRMQVNPHFLFNTLHAISSLVERDPQGVRRMIARLGELLRYTLENGTEAEVPLRQELDFLERYLDIQHIRFQGRLEVDIEAEPDAEEGLLPVLILQPLVENAVEHGASKADGVGRVWVEAQRRDDRLVVRIEDNGPGFDPDAVPDAPRRFGLRNTRERLEEIYGESFELAFHAREGGGLIAEVSVPFHVEPIVRTPAPSENLESDAES